MWCTVAGGMCLCVGRRGVHACRHERYLHFFGLRTQSPQPLVFRNDAEKKQAMVALLTVIKKINEKQVPASDFRRFAKNFASAAVAAKTSSPENVSVAFGWVS